jgi:hypothetical protein
MDTLTKWFNEKVTEGIGTHAEPYQIFQAGVTAGAVSMRTRAMSAATQGKNANEVRNLIGSLPDIPTEG